MQVKINNQEFLIDHQDNQNNINFWERIHKWEPQTFKIFDKYLNNNSIVADIGSWIGPTVLYSAKIAKHVYAFEPDVIALNNLRLNIKLNNLDNITVIDSSVSIDNYEKYMLMFGNSESKVDFTDSSKQKIKSLTFTKFLKDYNLKNVDFIKMDVEGHEFQIIPTMINYLEEFKTPLLLSIHKEELRYPHELDVLKIILKTIYTNFIDGRTGEEINIFDFETDMLFLF